MTTNTHVRKLRGLISGYQVSIAIGAFARLEIADKIQARAYDIKELAKECRVLPDKLERLLCYLEEYEIVARDSEGRFKATELSDLLRSENIDGEALIAKQGAYPWHWNAWGRLFESLYEDKSAFELGNATTFFEYLSHHSEANDLFNRLMGSSVEVEQAIARELRTKPGDILVDVGGGRGVLAVELQRQNPDLKLIVFDLPQVSPHAHSYFKEQEAQTIVFQPGSFFTDELPSADTIVLKWILHDWNDQDAKKILARCHKALRPGGRLVIVEGLVLPNSGGCPRMLDLTMMVITGGKERSEEHYSALLSDSGFVLQSTQALQCSRAFYMLEVQKLEN